MVFLYLHLGNNIIVNDKDIIGIFDMDNTTVSKHTRKYLAERTKNKEVVNVSFELPKSFIVCNNKKKNVVYVSQLASKTLTKRQNFLKNL
ncbi:MAG: DUF370 domain-containing protein [Acutalibacteraceae bacterium]|nr:DUF370 domain-containing protein [Acutalibacteraceae bacterium]